MWRKQLVLAAVGLLAGCMPSKLSRQDLAVEEQALDARVNGWAKAFSNQQLDSLATYYEQSDMLSMAWPDGQVSQTWEEEAAFQKAFFDAAGQVNLVVQDLGIEVVSPTIAIMTFRHATDVITEQGTPQRRYFTGVGTLVWMRANARSPWLIHTGQLSETPAAPQPPPPAARR
jgi:ketosteroid isomerase-like protein